MYHLGISLTGRFLALAALYLYQVGGYMRLDNLQLPHTTSNFLYGHSGQGGHGNQSGHDGQVGHGQDRQERQN